MPNLIRSSSSVGVLPPDARRQRRHRPLVGLDQDDRRRPPVGEERGHEILDDHVGVADLVEVALVRAAGVGLGRVRQRPSGVKT